jgi:hypothetical protein
MSPRFDLELLCLPEAEEEERQGDEEGADEY